MTSKDLAIYFRIGACISIFFSDGLQMSLNGPFYPEEAQKKGLPQSIIGLSTGVQYMARCLGSIFVMTTATAQYQKYFFAGGAFNCGITLICFSQLTYGPGGVSFALMSSLCRTWTGFASAGVWGTGFSTITSFYPKNEGTIAGVIESSYGAGSMIGPLIGNVLYSYGGYPLPFIFAGVFGMISSIVGLLSVPQLDLDLARDKSEEKNEDYSDDEDLIDELLSETEVSAFSRLTSLPVILSSFPVATVNSSIGFVSVALAPYLLQKYGIGSEANGKYFFSIFGVTMVASAVFGFLIDKGFGGKFYASSIFASSIGYLLLFFPAVLPSADNEPILFIALFLIGFGIAGAYTGSYIVNEKAFLQVGVRDPKKVKIYVLTGLTLWVSLGIINGQTVTGGWIYNCSNFNIACLSQLLIIVVFGVPTLRWMWKTGLLGQIYYHAEVLEEDQIGELPVLDGGMREPCYSRENSRQLSMSYSHGDTINTLVSSSVKIKKKGH